MELFNSKNIGKTFFWTSFLCGNFCLFGNLISGEEGFAIAGLLVLVYGGLINLLVLIGILIFGFFNEDHRQNCYNSALIMLINIPIALLYAFMGLSYVK